MSSGSGVIFILEDEQDLAELIRYNLALEGYQARVFSDGLSGFRAIEKEGPDLILLDLMLPQLDGLEICRRLKSSQSTKTIPVIMVTARGEESDVVKGLEFGADDYVVKPFSPQVLVARVKSVLRRSQSKLRTVEEVIRVHNIHIHPGRHEVLVDEEKLDLTHSEYQILHLLARKPGWVFTRTQIVDAIRGDNYAVTDRSIDFQMVGLRRKLGSAGPFVETVRGVGYRFKDLGSG